MLRSEEKEQVFFDAADYFSEGSEVGKEELSYNNLDYEIWMSEPRSVEERKHSFICSMNFLEFDNSHEMTFTKESTMTVLDRTREINAAVSSSCALSIDSVEKSMDCSKRDSNGKANCMADEFDQDQLDLNIDPERQSDSTLSFTEQFGHRQNKKKSKDIVADKKKMKSWWKRLKSKMERTQCIDVSMVLTPVTKTPKVGQMKVQQAKKKFMEFTAIYVGQELHAHEGLIRTMKFSPDGRYLASGGEDGVVRIWRVTSAGTYRNLHAKCNCDRKDSKSGSGMKKSTHASVIIPDKDFQIEKFPVQEFHDHNSDILDLAWSNTNCLLSSSKDKTVRLWKVGHDECIGVFHHNNYVTCTQFNPVDENYFISGSIDGKVRIWGVSEKRVVDWADVRDVITAICYHPNGEQFTVGSLSGTCRFYEASDSDLLLNAEIHIHGRKKLSGNRITGIQYLQEHSQKVMITSEDSKIRIFDGIDVVHKYKGLSKSGSQMSASFTSTGRHIISVGADSHIYVWNYDDTRVSSSSKQTKSVRSCEHFFYEGVSVVIPWSGMVREQKGTLCCCSFPHFFLGQNHSETTACIGDSDRFSLSNWLFMDGSHRGSATWPEEKLPLWEEPADVQDHPSFNNHDHQHKLHNYSLNHGVLSETWGLVIVAAGRDGMIRTFHNYGLPVRNKGF